MSGVDPNEKDRLSQEEIDAALPGAAGDVPAKEAAAEGAAEPAAPQAETTAETVEPTAPQAETTAEAVEPTAAHAEAAQETSPETTSAPAPASSDAEQPVEAVSDQAAAPSAGAADGGLPGLSQTDIDAALAGAAGEPAPAAASAPESVKLDSAGRPFDEMAAMMEAAIAEERAAAQASPPTAAAAPTAQPPPPPPHSVPLDLPDFSAPSGGAAPAQGIELLNDVELNVKIELGRAEMLIEEVIKLGEGSVVELDKLAGDPVDVLVNDRLVARGEVIVLNENFCVRISEIVAGIPEEEAA